MMCMNTVGQFLSTLNTGMYQKDDGDCFADFLKTNERFCGKSLEKLMEPSYGLIQRVS